MKLIVRFSLKADMTQYRGTVSAPHHRRLNLNAAAKQRNRMILPLVRAY